MNPWSLDLLEYEDLRSIVGRFVGSPLGRACLDAMQPTADRLQAETRLAELREAIAYLDAAREGKGSAVRLRFSDLPDVADSAARLRIEGVVLDAEEIRDLTAVLGRAVEARGALAPSSPLLAALVAPIPDLRPVLRELEGKVLPDGTLADDASPELARLRRERTRQKAALQQSLERFLRANRDSGLVQEDFVTVRNDRFVVPVAAGSRRRVEGVIHGASSTGQTLYMEPLETIGLNNDLVRLSEEELRETHRILRELTAHLRGAGDAIPQAVRILGDLDFLFARADYAIRFDCTIPAFSPAGVRKLSLLGARHPILADVLREQKKPIVPITVHLGEENRMLLITGPNTGGKTVALKTAGLFALMAQSGLAVPCERCELPFFEQVLADIGDNQSIAESLSSFSAHATRIASIVDAATRDSLVLLDELGRATDPEEGGALGVAVVDEIRQTGAFLLASTHLMALKVYGATTPGVENGSMGFNEDTLSPTYVLKLGAPGRSAGLAIASRLGMPARLIERARAAMSSQERDIAHFLSELHAKLESAAWLEAQWRDRTASLAEREKQFEAESARKRDEQARTLQDRSERLLADFEARSREAIEEIRAAAAQRKAADQAQLAASRTAREIRQQVAEVTRQTTGATSAAPKLEPGVRVRLKGIRDVARVRRLLPQDKIEVDAGLLKMQVPASDVTEILPPGEVTAKLPKNVSFESGPSWTLSEREINVIGRTAQDAREEIDRFLDKAALAGVDRVRIVHGHGMGVLKRAVAEMLGRHPHVERFEAATQGEGGAGATIAWMRQ